MSPSRLLSLVLVAAVWHLPVSPVMAQDREVLRVWPDAPPGDATTLPPEADTSNGVSDLVAGRSVIRLGNVTTPTLTVYPAPAARATGAAVVICPGGGHRILAMDIEGSEVAAWLNGLGVTAFVLKYRVPARTPGPRGRAAVEDAQRAISLVRSQAARHRIDPARIGVLGFSAGGEAAGVAAIQPTRQYPATDTVDAVSHRPDFAILAYPAWLANDAGTGLRDGLTVSRDTPPMFLVQAQDDFVPVANSVQMFLALKAHGVPAELHVYAAGGHGYGLRATTQPVTTWQHRAADWLKASGWLSPRR